MRYIIIGMLFGIGLGIAETLWMAIQEILFKWLHRVDWYINLINGRIGNKRKNKTSKNKIGFM